MSYCQIRTLAFVEQMFSALNTIPVDKQYYVVSVTPIKWHVGVMVMALDSHLKRSQVQFPLVPLSGNNLGQVVHTCL